MWQDSDISRVNHHRKEADSSMAASIRKGKEHHHPCCGRKSDEFLWEDRDLCCGGSKFKLITEIPLKDDRKSPVCVWKKAGVTRWRRVFLLGLGYPWGRRLCCNAEALWSQPGYFGGWLHAVTLNFQTEQGWAQKNKTKVFVILLPMAVLDCTKTWSKANALGLVRRTFCSSWGLKEHGTSDLLQIWGCRRLNFFLSSHFPNTISGQTLAFHQCKSVSPPTRTKSLEPIPLLLFCT